MKITSRTSESVTEGHPDKLADRISDTILDSVLDRDPHAHVACEVFITTGLVVVGGEITTERYVDVETAARNAIQKVGYDKPEYGFNFQDCAVLSSIQEQSTDIASAVDRISDQSMADHYEAVGAGDQGIMYGYACDATEERMPLPIVLAHRLARRLSQVRRQGVIPNLRPDGKTQVTVAYEGDRPLYVSTVLIAAQHDPDVRTDRLKDELSTHVIRPILDDWLDHRTEILINSSGRFVIGGPKSDTGMTGRKIIVDTYGGHGSHGGGAFSGKDPTKVDRSGAYMARCVASHVVAAGLARQVEVQIAYAIGRAAPLAVNLQTYSTGKLPDARLREAVMETFDFRPGAIIEQLDLLRPIYEPFSCYGHFGRTDANASWERTDRTEELLRATR